MKVPRASRRKSPITRILTNVLEILTPRERFQALGLLFLMLCGALSETVGIGMIVPFIAILSDPTAIHTTHYLQKAYEFLGSENDREFIFSAALLLAGVIIVKNLLVAFINYVQGLFLHAKEVSLSCWVFKRYMYAPYSYHLKRNSSDLTRVISVEIPRVTSGFLQPLMVSISELIVIIGIVLLLALMNPLPTLLAFTGLGSLSVLISVVLRNRLTKFRDSVKIHGETAQRWVSQALGAQKEIRIFGVPEYFEHKLESNLKIYAQGYASFTFLNQSPRLILESIAMALMLGGVGFYILRSGNGKEAIPVIALFALATVRIMPSVTKIIGAINSMKFFSPAFTEVVQGIRNVPEGSAIAEDRHPGDEIVLGFTYENVSFRHVGTEGWSLKDLNFSIPAGKCTAIVGFSGAGKSTLAELLLGLLKPEQGGISVHDASGNSPARAVRFAYVPQSPYLLDDTVRRNVAFGIADADIDDSAVIAALSAANLDKRLLATPNGLDDCIGERGSRLSGGERQRLAIARAIYRNPDVIVFDEATSALDRRTEAEISETIFQLAGRKTIILITHQLTLAAACDNIVFLEGGRLVGMGGFEFLMQTSDRFRHMYEEADASASEQGRD